LKQRVEAVAETWLASARPNERSHAVVDGVGRNAADGGNVGARDLKKLRRIWIVQQSQQQMLKGNETMGPLLGCSSGAP
jgi:NAD(P)H-hydrate repair Nnr-like enzyme with NAD(P)H-hydrate epimerase domain